MKSTGQSSLNHCPRRYRLLSFATLSASTLPRRLLWATQAVRLQLLTHRATYHWNMPSPLPITVVTSVPTEMQRFREALWPP